MYWTAQYFILQVWFSMVLHNGNKWTHRIVETQTWLCVVFYYSQVTVIWLFCKCCKLSSEHIIFFFFVGPLRIGAQTVLRSYWAERKRKSRERLKRKPPNVEEYAISGLGIDREKVTQEDVQAECDNLDNIVQRIIKYFHHRTQQLSMEDQSHVLKMIVQDPAMQPLLERVCPETGLLTSTLLTNLRHTL